MEKIIENLQNVMDKDCAAQKFAGMNCLVFKDNRELCYLQTGFSNLENKTPFNRDTICRFYSLSKPVTSVACMLLIEQGKLSFIDKLSDFFPEFSNLKVCNTERVNSCSTPILIKDLLNMTSGYTYGGVFDEGQLQTSRLLQKLNVDVQTSNKISTQDFVKEMAEIPLSFEPGTSFCYGLSADILGAVIEKVSGLSLREFYIQNIFEPLQMKDTDFYVPEEKQSRLSNIYTSLEDENHNFSLEKFEKCNLGIQYKMDHIPSFLSGGAGLCSTIDDYMKFALMLVNKGKFEGKRILSRKSVEYLTESKLPSGPQKEFEKQLPLLSGFSYSNLMRVCQEPGRALSLTEKGEIGWDGWLGPYLCIDIKNNLVILNLMQRTDSGTTNTSLKLKNIIYSFL